MDRTPTLLAFVALASLPVSASAQTRSTALSARTVVAAARQVSATPIALTRRGVHRTLEHTIADGLAVVDRQQVDVDGDGDLDAIVMLDVAEDRDPKPESGRGVAVIYHEPHGWRAETIASVPRMPLEAGYNWGPVESLRAGGPPLLHLLYSQAPAGERARASDTVLLYDHGALRPVLSRSIETTSGSGADTVVRALSVQAADVDGDGTSELLERVAESAHCPDGECMSEDGMHDPTVVRRAYRWEAVSGHFVEEGALAGHQAAAQRELERATQAWHLGDLVARDAGITRAFALDPLDPQVRLAYARMALRARNFEAGLSALEFAWPEGLGREAQALRAEAAVAAHSASCAHEVGLLRESSDPDTVARAGVLAAASPDCR